MKNEPLIHRLKIVRGHIGKIIQMVDEEAYCVDVIHQSQAVQAALRQIDQVVLKRHLETCVARSIREGKSKNVINEIMEVVEKT